MSNLDSNMDYLFCVFGSQNQPPSAPGVQLGANPENCSKKVSKSRYFETFFDTITLI